MNSIWQIPFSESDNLSHDQEILTFYGTQRIISVCQWLLS